LNSLLTTLIDILRVSASIGENQNTLRVAPTRDILVDICSQQVPQDQIDQLAEVIVACAAGRSATLPNLDAIELALSGPACAARLARADTALNEMLLLHYALHTDVDRPVNLTISHPHFFDYLQYMQISSAPNHPRIVLVGALLPAQEKVDLRFDASTHLLKRIAISYGTDSPYPYLDLKLWSISRKMPARAERQEYQLPDAQYDFDLWTRDNRIKGEIRTRRVDLPYAVNTAQISMHINALAGLELLETSVLDSEGTILASCLRMARHVAR
jgi:hypothetical protein